MNGLSMDVEDRYRSDITDTRKRAFVLALQGLYQIDIANVTPEAAVSDVVPVDCPPKVSAAVHQLVPGVIAEKDEIDDLLRQHLNCNWALERLGLIECNVLRLGAYIIRHAFWSSPASVRDLAAHIAVEYSSNNSHGLVKAVLDAIIHHGESQQ